MNATRNQGAVTRSEQDPGGNPRQPPLAGDAAQLIGLDEQPLHRLIEATAESTLHCVTFTSAPAATNFLRTAARLGRDVKVRAALKSTVLAAAVGPVAAGPLLRADIPVAQPDRHRLGALVNEVVRRLPTHRSPTA